MKSWDLVRYTGLQSQNEQELLKEANRRIKLSKTDSNAFQDIESNERTLVTRFARTKQDVFNPFEKNIGSIDYQDANILEILLERAKAVCCIFRNGLPIGSGFLVAENVIITNNHVIRSREESRFLEARFEYELDVDKKEKNQSVFKLNPDIFFLTSTLAKEPSVSYSGLDFTLIGVERLGLNEEPIANYKPAYLDGNEGKFMIGDNCIIIHHPEGKPKQVSIKDSTLFYTSDDFLFYESDTVFGSSGSMVVALGTGEIVALHHAGQPNMDENSNILTRTGSIANEYTLDSEIDWIANKGIRIDKIINAIRYATLEEKMEPMRQALLKRTDQFRLQLTRKVNENIKNESSENNEEMDNINSSGSTTMGNLISIAIKDANRERNNPFAEMMKKENREGSGATEMVDFLVLANYNETSMLSIRSYLKGRYGDHFTFLLTMPDTAIKGNPELFSLSILVSGNPEETARQLAIVPGVMNAETDIPIALNSGFSGKKVTTVNATESLIEEDGYSKPNEQIFLNKYRDSSPYVKGKTHDPSLYRKWNWFATRFDKINYDDLIPGISNIRIVQFDTGWTNHQKVEGQFDIDMDFDFLNKDDSAEDDFIKGVLKFPGHGTRTGSLLIGHQLAMIEGNGNEGFLTNAGVKLIPYRIAETVLLVNRQKQLAEALDRAIAKRYDVITMSMGTVPTFSTAVMARKAYEAGIIWCCASGNVVQAVIAPAVYPGTIAVAASNPDDKDWPGSSRGPRIDITAPGQDVYVPIFTEPLSGQRPGETMSYGDGTSFATPHVAAAAALWLTKYEKELNSKEFEGWKRVEAFRKALKVSARKDHKLPLTGFGAGILDFEKLLKQKPKKLSAQDHAYYGINESAFYQTLQAWSEGAKTLWNRFHGLFLSGRDKASESLAKENTLSGFSLGLLNELNTNRYSNYESIQTMDAESLETNLNLVLNKLQPIKTK